MKVGVLGGGQLARMLAQAGTPLGLEFMFVSPDPQACAASWGEHLCASFEDPAGQRCLAEWADVVTYEFENVPVASVASLERQRPVHPSSRVLAMARDRLLEKRCFRTLDVPTVEFAAVDSLADLINAAADIGLPAILKTRTEGYDGKGQVVLRKAVDLPAAWEKIGKVPCIVESMVSFDRELSIIAVRAPTGATAFYPLSENHHRQGILRLSLSRAGDAMQAQAQSMIGRLLQDLNYVGVLALELFQVGNRLLANEMAPRVHNSGHWTIEGAPTSQFENHLRAVCNLPLGATSPIQPSAMINLIGHLPPEADIRAVPGATPHFYGKTERPGRKVGHVTLVCADCAPEVVEWRLARLLQLAGAPEFCGQGFVSAASGGRIG